MHCEIGGTQGPLEYLNALGATRLVHWLILVAPSCLRSHNARYIMLKSLNRLDCSMLSISESEWNTTLTLSSSLSFPFPVRLTSVARVCCYWVGWWSSITMYQRSVFSPTSCRSSIHVRYTLHRTTGETEAEISCNYRSGRIFRC